MRYFVAAVAVFIVAALTSNTQAAVYIGGGCYDCNPPGGQAPGVYTSNGGRGGNSYYPTGGGGGGGGGRPVYTGNFGPNGYNGGAVSRPGSARYGGGGGGSDYSGEVIQYIGGRGGALVQRIGGY